MGRLLRHYPPESFNFVTTRCHQARFFLRPDHDLNRAILEWLARAQRHRPGIRIHAILEMSNHLHAIVRDSGASLAFWAQHLLGSLAGAVSALRDRSGAVGARRDSAEPILDDDAILERVAFLATNPVSAHLVDAHEDWPGLLLLPDGARERRIPVSRIDHDR